LPKNETAGRAFEQWLSAREQMKRELTPEEHEEIVKAVATGDRVDVFSGVKIVPMLDTRGRDATKRVQGER